MRYILLCTLLLAAACGVAPDTIDDDEIARAAADYLRSEAAIQDFRIEVEKVEGDFARVSAIPADLNKHDAAIAFLKREKGRWRVLIYGTAFGPDDYQELNIPPAVWLPD